MNIRECLFGLRQIHHSWVQHAFIAVSAVSTAGLLLPGYQFAAALGASASFIYVAFREQPRRIPWRCRLVADSHTIGDWLFPTVAAFLVALLFAAVEPSTVSLIR